MQSGGIEREVQPGLFFPVDLTEGKDMAVASNGAEKIFERVKTQLKARLGGEVYSSWFGRMKLNSVMRIFASNAAGQASRPAGLVSPVYARTGVRTSRVSLAMRPSARPVAVVAFENVDGAPSATM